MASVEHPPRRARRDAASGHYYAPGTDWRGRAYGPTRFRPPRRAMLRWASLASTSSSRVTASATMVGRSALRSQGGGLHALRVVPSKPFAGPVVAKRTLVGAAGLGGADESKRGLALGLVAAGALVVLSGVSNFSPVSAAQSAPLCEDAKPTQEPKASAETAAPPAEALPTAGVVTTKSWSYYKGLKVQDKDRIALFAGNGNRPLAEEVAGYLGLDLGNATVGRFHDGEVNVQINENVRGKDIFIVQSTCPPVDENMIELLLMVSCLRRAAARRITVVMPYVGYARASVMQDQSVPISASAVAIMLQEMGVDRVVAVDLSAGQIQGFFKPTVPSDNLETTRVGANYFADSVENLKQPFVVAIRANSVSRAKDFRDTLVGRGKKSNNDDLAGTSLGMVIRQDLGPTELSAEGILSREGEGEQEEAPVGIELVGMENIEGADVILVDDIIDTARTLCAAAFAVKARGAGRVFAFASHGIFSRGALERIQASPIDCVVVTNTVSAKVDEDNQPATGSEKIVRLSVAPLLAETIRRIFEKESLGDSVFKMTPKFERRATPGATAAPAAA